RFWATRLMFLSKRRSPRLDIINMHGAASPDREARIRGDASAVKQPLAPVPPAALLLEWSRRHLRISSKTNWTQPSLAGQSHHAHLSSLPSSETGAMQRWLLPVASVGAVLALLGPLGGQDKDKPTYAGP